MTSCREPVACVPVPPATVHEHDPIIMAAPPTTGMPLPVVIAEHHVPLAAERVTTPVVSDSNVATTIKSGVLCPIDRDVSIPIDRYVIATAKLIGVARTVNVRVSSPVHCDVPFTIHADVSCPVHRGIPFAIPIDVCRAIGRDISAARCRRCGRCRPSRPGVPRNVSLANCSLRGGGAPAAHLLRRWRRSYRFSVNCRACARRRVRPLPRLRG